MTAQRQQMGKMGEAAALTELQRRGYQIVAQNWRCQAGEADIVALHNHDVVIVEVRTRTGSNGLESALESITPTKAAKLRQIAHAYYAYHGDDSLGLRVDVVAVRVLGGTTKLEIYENALEEG